MLEASSGWRERVIEMSPLRGLVTSKREQVLDVAARHHANRVRLFGSVARGDDSPGSDIDFLVDFSQDSSLFDLMRMARELEELLGHRVDVVSTGGLKKRDQHILGESIDL
jgi:predicted nucleotidyltransferase